MMTAAIILAAGKGTRMGNALVNKVAFDCAGTPVIRRVVDQMREGGVERFVIVVGHRAESVMGALSGVPGVLFAYQAEQKGTGHAAQCGLDLLLSVGFEGRVIISMGDKIVAPRVVKAMLAGNATGSGHTVSCVLGVQPRPAGPSSRGHVVVDERGQTLGIVEAKDIQRALDTGSDLSLCGRAFSPAIFTQPPALNSQPSTPNSQLSTLNPQLSCPYLNAALYCFDARALAAELTTLRADNAQGEIYLTDTVERFASRGELAVHVIENPDDLLTYSRKRDLRRIILRYLPKEDGRPYLTASAPGRVNLMGRHVEHRGGSTNMMAIEQRTVFRVFPREDTVVTVHNTDPRFPDASFDISDFFNSPYCTVPGTGTVPSRPVAAPSARWIDYLDDPATKAELASSRGHWVNYVKGAVYRFQMATSMPLLGMDIQASGDIPVAAGLSSSSSLVVATAEALVALNALNLSTRDFVDFCGEAEWFVGSRGGAGDHAAMKCSRAGYVTHLKFKPFEIGEAVKFPSNCAIIVVDSGEKAKKSEGAKETFNARIRDYEEALATVKRVYPELPLTYFRDLAFLPEADLGKALACLTGTVRGVATFGVKECRRAEDCLGLLKRGDFAALGEMMKSSHDGDRLGKGEYECSTKRIDALCDRLNSLPGVLGSQLVGAGLGGCVIALAESSAAPRVIDLLRADGFNAFVTRPSRGSEVVY